MDPLSIQVLAECVPVEVGEFARTWESPHIGNDSDLERFKEMPKFFKRPIGMSNSEKP
jgi:hypothetical protein